MPCAELHRTPEGEAYRSGTAYEIETALAAQDKQGKSEVYVFFSDRPPELEDSSAETFERYARNKRALEQWRDNTSTIPRDAREEPTIPLRQPSNSRPSWSNSWSSD